MITTIISVLMITGGIELGRRLYLEYYAKPKEPSAGNEYDTIKATSSPAYNTRFEAKEAAGAFELDSRFKAMSDGMMTEAAMAFAMADGAFDYDANGVPDPIASSMLMSALESRAPRIDGAIVLTHEQRVKIAKDFANTHLGKIASFAHSIDKDGKLIVSADAVSFLSNTYDPILLPGGLVSIIVKNEIEASLYKAMISKTPIYTMNMDTYEVAKIDYEQIKRLVGTESIDDMVKEFSSVKDLKDSLLVEIKEHKRARIESDNKYELLEKKYELLENALSIAHEQLAACGEISKASKNSNTIVDIDANQEPSRGSSAPIKIQVADSKKLTNPIEVMGDNEVMKQAKIVSVAEKVKDDIFHSQSNIPCAAEQMSGKSLADTIETPSFVKAEKVEKIKFSSIINEFKEKNNLSFLLKNPLSWIEYSIGFISIDHGTAKVLFDKKLLLKKYGKTIEFDLSFASVLLFDDETDNAYFSHAFMLELESEPNIEQQHLSVYAYSKEAALGYVESTKNLGLGIDKKTNIMEDFISGKAKFPDITEYVL